MNKEEIKNKRQLIRERKQKALAKLCKAVNILSGVRINHYIITGSQALIIQGFITHRDGDDVDVRISIPTDPEEKARVYSILQAWAKLYEKQNTSDRYKEKNANEMFTFFIGDLKVNAFMMTEEEFNEIPRNLINGYFVEEVASVVYDKMRCGRGKDYQDMIQCVRTLLEE